MDHEDYLIFRDRYGFESINTRLGKDITNDVSPDAAYHLPEGKLNLYFRDPSLRDLIHPFAPSHKVIAEINVTHGDRKNKMYLSGSEEDFEKLDREIMNELEKEDNTNYFKEIM